MEDDCYTTDDERRFDVPADSNHYEMSVDNDFGLERFERMEYWEEIFTQKLKSIKANSSSSKYDTDPTLAHHPVIYEGSEIDMKALHELLSSQGLSEDKTKYVCNLVKKSIPNLSEAFLAAGNKTKLLDTENKVKKLILELKSLENQDKALIPYVESLSTYVDPIIFLSEVQHKIQDILQSYFPDGKKKRDHYRFTYSLGYIWKLNVSEPKVYNDSPFVQFVAICTCSTPEATKQRMTRHGMKRRIKAFAPF